MYIFFYLYGEPLWECESLVGWDNANECLPEIDPDIFTQLGMNMLFIHEMDGCFVSFKDISRDRMLRWPIHLWKLCIGTSANIIRNFKWWFRGVPEKIPEIHV